MENQDVELAAALDFVDSQIELAEALQRLKNNPDFKLVFEKRFVNDWALTQIANVGMYNMEARKGYLEQAIARGIFSAFMYEIEEDGKKAVEARRELSKEG